MWSNTAAATGLFTGHFVRKIPDVEQHSCYGTTVYGSIRSEQEVNTFKVWSNTPTICWSIRFDNPDLKQHRCYGTVYGSSRFIMYYYDFCFFAALPSSFSTWHRLHLALRIAFILQKMYYKPDIY